MANNFAIELLMTMKNMLGPQVAEAKAQVADLAATTTAANAEMTASTEAAAAAFTMPSVGMIAAVAAAGIGLLAFGGYLRTASDRMMEMGEQAHKMRETGAAMSYNQIEAEGFYLTVTDTKTRLAELGDEMLSHALPAINAIAEGFNGAARAAENAVHWFTQAKGSAPTENKAMRFTGIADYRPTGASDDFEAMLKSPFAQAVMDHPVYGPPMPEGLIYKNQLDMLRKHGSAARGSSRINRFGGSMRLPYGPFPEGLETDDGLSRLQDESKQLFAAMKVEFDKLNPSVARLSPTVQQIGQSVTQFAASAVTDIGHVGSAFKAMVREVLADLARQQVAKGVGSLLGALASGFGGGAGGGVVGGIKEATKSSVNVHISALNARDVLRDLTSSGGEMRGAYRAIDYGSRLP